MESVIERKAMVNSINDCSGFKCVDLDSKLQRTQTRKNESSASGASEVNLSDVSLQLAALKEIVLKAPEVNHARVEFLKEQLNSGRYQIISHQIAQRMYADVQMA